MPTACLLWWQTFTHFLPFNSVPVFFSLPQFLFFSLLSWDWQKISKSAFPVSVFTSAQSQTALVGSVNPQEMALFGNTAPPLCLACQAKVRHQMRLFGLKPKCFFYQQVFFKGLSLAFMALSDRRDRQETWRESEGDTLQLKSPVSVQPVKLHAECLSDYIDSKTSFQLTFTSPPPMLHTARLLTFLLCTLHWHSVINDHLLVLYWRSFMMRWAHIPAKLFTLNWYIVHMFIVFTLWVCAHVIMAKCGPGDIYCSGNYHRRGFEYFGRCLYVCGQILSLQ